MRVSGGDNGDDQYALRVDAMDIDKEKELEAVMGLSINDQDVSLQDKAYVHFMNTKDEVIGQMTGAESYVNGIAYSGVKLESAGADYAEYLERKNREEEIEGGDVVGVFEGKITKETEGAQRVMVVSSLPIVLGNYKGKEMAAFVEPVAFVGQVPVKIKGEVRAGDYVIPTGQGDGIAIAVGAAELKLEQVAQVIGQAWESSEAPGVKLVNMAIVPNINSHIFTVMLHRTIYRLDQENQRLNQQLQTFIEEFKSSQ